MNKNLPNVFANPISKKLKNTQETYYGNDRMERSVDSVSVERKIQAIFASREFVYKSRVEITTSMGTKDCVIVGKTDKSLLTLDNETIPIASILDIRKI